MVSEQMVSPESSTEAPVLSAPVGKASCAPTPSFASCASCKATALKTVCPAHTDVGVLTVIPTSNVAGLECRAADSGSWVCVEDRDEQGKWCNDSRRQGSATKHGLKKECGAKAELGHLCDSQDTGEHGKAQVPLNACVLLGDTICEFSGGLLPAAPHRVRLPPGGGKHGVATSRISISFHVYAKPNTTFHPAAIRRPHLEAAPVEAAPGGAPETDGRDRGSGGQRGDCTDAHSHEVGKVVRVSDIYAAKARKNSSATLNHFTGGDKRLNALLQSFLVL